MVNILSSSETYSSRGERCACTGLGDRGGVFCGLQLLAKGLDCCVASRCHRIARFTRWFRATDVATVRARRYAVHLLHCLRDTTRYLLDCLLLQFSSSSSSMPFATPQEKAIAEKVLATVSSAKYKGKNYLFLEPFALDQVPGYLEEVGKPLDLRTIRSNLQNDLYEDAASFWNDFQAVFQNAIKYHGKRETKWIAKYAKDMLKLLAKERKAAENPTVKKAAGGPKKFKLKLKPSPEQAAKQPPDVVSSAPEAAAGPLKQKPKLKLKLSSTKKSPPSAGGGAPSPAAVPSSSQQPAVPPPLHVAATTTTGSGKTEKVVPKKAKPTQPKFKLKLSLNKKSTPSGGGGGPSRGKELPQGVVAAAGPGASSSKPAAAPKAPKAKAAPKPKKTKKKAATPSLC